MTDYLLIRIILITLLIMILIVMFAITALKTGLRFNSEEILF